MGSVSRDHSDVGFDVLTGTESAPTGDYYGITVLDDAVVDSITLKPGYVANGLTGKTLPKGTYRPCLFTELTLASGTICVERAS